MFLVCDHFEPHHGIVREKQAEERMDIWVREYASFQQRCVTAFGTSPLHTWFYPPHHGYEHLQELARMAFMRLGEVELHYHHDGDTSASLRADLESAIRQYHQHGLLLESGSCPRTAFGFIHGDWALDNSAHGKFCGVNDELTILQELGCWGDFTMPSANECQTRKINSIYYAVDDPNKSKSHNWGKDASVGNANQPGLFMMQGPLGINWRAPRYPRIENANLTSSNWGRPDRIKKWLDCHVHVKGRPEWIFVKLHTHGAIEGDFDALFGQKAYEMHRILNEEYNDGQRYRLHYVTAREAYNIAKAAEAGKNGDPSEYRDFSIRPYANTYYCIDEPHQLNSCTSNHLGVSHMQAPRSICALTRIGPVTGLRGSIEAFEVDTTRGDIRISCHEASAKVELDVKDGFVLEEITGGSMLHSQAIAGDTRRLTLSLEKHAVVKFTTQ